MKRKPGRPKKKAKDLAKVVSISMPPSTLDLVKKSQGKKSFSAHVLDLLEAGIHFMRGKLDEA